MEKYFFTHLIVDRFFPCPRSLVDASSRIDGHESCFTFVINIESFFFIIAFYIIFRFVRQVFKKNEECIPWRLTSFWEFNLKGEYKLNVNFHRFIAFLKWSRLWRNLLQFDQSESWSKRWPFRNKLKGLKNETNRVLIVKDSKYTTYVKFSLLNTHTQSLHSTFQKMNINLFTARLLLELLSSVLSYLLLHCHYQKLSFVGKREYHVWICLRAPATAFVQ